MSKITSTNYDLTSLTLKLHKMSKKKNLHCISRAWHVLFRFLWNNIIFNNTVYQYLLETQLERPFAKRIISKSWYRHRHQHPHRHRKKKLCCIPQLLCLSFEVTYEVKHRWSAPFQVPLQALLRDLAPV